MGLESFLNFSKEFNKAQSVQDRYISAFKAKIGKIYYQIHCLEFVIDEIQKKVFSEELKTNPESFLWNWSICFKNYRPYLHPEYEAYKIFEKILKSGHTDTESRLSLEIDLLTEKIENYRHAKTIIKSIMLKVPFEKEPHLLLEGVIEGYKNKESLTKAEFIALDVAKSVLEIMQTK